MRWASALLRMICGFTKMINSVRVTLLVELDTDGLEKPADAAVGAHRQFLAWLLPTVEKFPRSNKFSLRDAVLILAHSWGDRRRGNRRLRQSSRPISCSV
jgi:hypothetical protein